jgi:hypothetical protein
MATTAQKDANEQARRREFMRDTKGALAQGQSFEKHAKNREDKADEWSNWFRRKMDEGGINDPVQLLPDAFARLEQLAEDKAAAAVKELKAQLREVLK